MPCGFPSPDRRQNSGLTGVPFKPDIICLGFFLSGAWITRMRDIAQLTSTTKDEKHRLFHKPRWGESELTDIL